MSEPILVDCTLRDGGYHNGWNFGPDLIADYLDAMKAVRVDVVEMGFRFLGRAGAKGPCAYTSDAFLRSLAIPEPLKVAVMVNGADLLGDAGMEAALACLFPETTETSPVRFVRFACHFAEFRRVLPAVAWLHDRGYRVGFNLMQASDRTKDDVQALAREAGKWPIEVLYFADSLGSMTPAEAARIVHWMRDAWHGDIGVHTHDNMGLALQNTLSAHQAGARWLDATVTGMGRGPGNARIEELIIETGALLRQKTNLAPMMTLIDKHFGPMKGAYGWGTNPYYYLSGKYGIHPSYIQEMLGDAGMDAEDILAAIEHLRLEGGKTFSENRLGTARHVFRAERAAAGHALQ